MDAINAAAAKKGVKYVTTQVNPSTFSEQMLANNTKYYIAQDKTLNIPHFKEVKKIGEVDIYQKV